MSVHGQVVDCHISELEDELTPVTRRTLGEIYKDPRKEDVKRFPSLTRIVRGLRPSLWEEDPTRALLVVVRKAIENLPDGGPEGSKTGWREIGEFLCGFKKGVSQNEEDDTNFARNDQLTYNDYVAALRTATGIGEFVSKRTFHRRVTAPFRRHLAKALLTLKEMDFSEETPSAPRYATSSSTSAPLLIQIVPPPPTQPAARSAPFDQLRRITQARSTFGVALSVLLGVVLGWLVVPRLYEPSQVWQGPFREPSMFVISSFRLLAPIVCVTVLLVTWLLTSALVNWRPLSRRRAVICISLGMVAVVPVYLVGAVEFAHRREVSDAATLPSNDSSGLFMLQDFERVNNPNDGFAACTPHGETSVLPDNPDSTFVSCDEINGAVTLRAINGQSFSAQAGRSLSEENSYTETLFAPNRMGEIWAGCGISILAVDDASASRNFTLEIVHNESSLRFRPVVIEYKNRGTSQEVARILQRSSLTLPAKLGDDEEFDQSPREGWLKLGVLRKGNKYKLFINDHLVLAHAWVHAPESVRMQIEAHADGSVPLGFRSCSFDYFKQWKITS